MRFNLDFKLEKNNFCCKTTVLYLYIYHFVVSISAYYFTLHNISDAKYYWFITQNPSEFIAQQHLPLREYLISYINYFFAITLDLPYWFGFTLYSSIGFIGIYLLYCSNIKLNFSRPFFFFIIITLPSMHFWTSFIGKEPIVFLAISMIIHSLLNIKFNSLIIIGFIILMLIRPHVAITLALSIAIAYLINKKSINVHIVLGFLFLSATSLYVLLSSHWLGGLSIGDLENLFHTHHEALRTTHTYVPLENYNIFYKIFTFYFRPFPFEFNTLMGWIMSLENMMSLGVTIVGLFALIQLLVKHQYKPTIAELSILIFFILLAAVLTLAYSNFGLISRMKNQSQPFMLLLCLHWINLYRNKRIV